MKKLFLLISISLFSLIAFSSQVHAASVTLTYGDIGYTFDSYVGFSVDGTPADPVSAASYINALIIVPSGNTNFYNSGVDQYLTNVDSNFLVPPSLPTAVPAGWEENTTGNNEVSVSDYDYILAKYGNASLVWYIGGVDLSGYDNVYIQPSWTPPSGYEPPDEKPIGSIGGALSHYTLYNQVPIPSSIVLLGFGLVGLVGFRRNKQS